MRPVVALCFALGIAHAPAGARDDPPAKLSLEELCAEANRCVVTLWQFRVVHRDFFPDGFKKAEDGPHAEKGVWPPPDTWSWRVAVLPFLEQNVLYKSIHELSDGFKTPGTLPEEKLNKHGELVNQLGMMPSWMALPHGKKDTGQTVFRRVVVKDKPGLFIIVESSDLALWFRPTDDLQLADDKPLPKMGGNFPNGFFALCGDGKVHFLPKTMTEKEVRKALLTGEGGSVIRAEYSRERKADIARLDFGK